MIFVIYKFGRLGLGEVRFGMCKLGEVSFEKYMLDYLGKVSFGMSYLSELGEFVNLEHEFGKLIFFLTARKMTLDMETRIHSLHLISKLMVTVTISTLQD